MDEYEFYSGVYREAQDSGVEGWYVRQSHKSLERRSGFLRKSGDSEVDAPLGTILEVGGNIGEHIKFVKDPYSRYLLTDYRATGFKSEDLRVKFEVADVQNLPFEAGVFDRVIATCLLYHVPDPYRALSEMRRVTREGGIVSILVPCDPGVVYRLAKRLGPSKVWKAKGINNPDFYHYTQHRNHYPGLLACIAEAFKTDQVVQSNWPFLLRSWNLNLFSVFQVTKGSVD